MSGIFMYAWCLLLKLVILSESRSTVIYASSIISMGKTYFIFKVSQPQSKFSAL